MRVKTGESPSQNVAAILLNGVKQYLVFEADDDECFIVRYRTDANGRPIANKEGDALETEKLFGAVQVVFKEQNHN